MDYSNLYGGIVGWSIVGLLFVMAYAKEFYKYTTDPYVDLFCGPRRFAAFRFLVVAGPVLNVFVLALVLMHCVGSGIITFFKDLSYHFSKGNEHMVQKVEW